MKKKTDDVLHKYLKAGELPEEKDERMDTRTSQSPEEEDERMDTQTSFCSFVYICWFSLF